MDVGSARTYGRMRGGLREPERAPPRGVTRAGGRLSLARSPHLRRTKSVSRALELRDGGEERQARQDG